MGEHWGTSETDQPINLERMELEQNWRSPARDAPADLDGNERFWRNFHLEEHLEEHSQRCSSWYWTEMKDFGGIFTLLKPAGGPIYYYTYDLIDWPRVPKIAQMHWWGQTLQVQRECVWLKEVSSNFKRQKGWQLSRPQQGSRCWGNAGTAFPERSESSTKGRPPNIRYFVAKLSIVAIYALFEAKATKVILLWESFQRNSACFWRALNKSQPAFEEVSESPLSESFRRAFRDLSESLLS